MLAKDKVQQSAEVDLPAVVESRELPVSASIGDMPVISEIPAVGSQEESSSDMPAVE